MWLRIGAVVMIATATSCGDSSALDRVAEGAWGGLHVQLQITAEGGSLQFDCARGTIDEPPVLDKDGDFAARGVYVRGQPGPVRDNEPEERTPARYSGNTDGRTMTLRVTSADGQQSFGEFALTFGQRGRVFPCL